MSTVIPTPVQAAIRYINEGAQVDGSAALDSGALDDVVTQVNAIGLMDTSSVPARAQESIVAARELLGVGDYQGIVLDGQGIGSVQGISKKVYAGPFVCEAGPIVMLSNLEMRGELQNGCVLLVKAGARAVVSDCIFTSKSPKTVVLVESGGRLLLSNCVFRGMGTTTEKVIHNQVATPANVVATMCFNATGNTFHDAANVTATHILT
jgi:hypothetical protein